MAQAMEGHIRIETDRKRVRKERKRVEIFWVEIFWVFCFVFNPRKKTVPPFFQPYPINKIPFQTVDK